MHSLYICASKYAVANNKTDAHTTLSVQPASPEEGLYTFRFLCVFFAGISRCKNVYESLWIIDAECARLHFVQMCGPIDASTATHMHMHAY